jgi:acetoin utilization protein AcuB
MLVKDCMTRHPAMVPPTMPAAEAQKVMMENKVRHLPVVGDGKRLVGLITRQCLAFKPDTLLSLNVWEITRYLSELKVKDLMLKASEVHTIGPDQTVERAARMLTDHKIGCLPVIENGIVVGILSEVDLLRSYQEMLGLPAEGVRVTMRMPDRKGEFARLMTVLVQRGWGVMGVGTFPSPKRPGFYDAVIKIPKVTLAEVQETLSQVTGQEIVDIREAV